MDLYERVWRFNPNHIAAGQAGGGQFAPASGGSGSAKSGKGGKGAQRPTPSNQHPVGMGETGQRVHDLQERLNALGFKPPLKVDGIFGPKTLAAVRAFQKAHGLKVDGLVGPRTTAALRLKQHKPAKHHAKHHHAAHHKTTTAKTTAKTPAKPPVAAKAPAQTPAQVKRADTWAAQWAQAWASR